MVRTALTLAAVLNAAVVGASELSSPPPEPLEKDTSDTLGRRLSRFFGRDGSGVRGCDDKCLGIMPPHRDASWYASVLGAAGLTPSTAAEVGVGNRAGLGGTSHALAKVFHSLHLFDFEDVLSAQMVRLRRHNSTGTGTGTYATVVPHPNSHLPKDSYTYSLKALLRLPAAARPVFDYVYIDAAHEWQHDGFAFLLLDKMLRDGGIMEFDDYEWSFANSPTVMHENGDSVRLQYPPSQISEPQVKEVVDLLVATNPRYVTLKRGRIYRKLRSEYIQP